MSDFGKVTKSDETFNETFNYFIERFMLLKTQGVKKHLKNVERLD